MTLKRARLDFDGELCGREGCDSRINSGGSFNLIEIHDEDRQVYLRLCEKCLKALADGKWTPTRQTDRALWRPNEKQLHPVVQGALNRDMFRLPPMNWIKEAELGDSRLDLVAFVHGGSYASQPPGIHVIEVKLADDTDGERVRRQLSSAIKHANYVWLVVVDADPDIRFDKRVGLIRYDLVADHVKLVRKAEKVAGDVDRLYSEFEAYMEQLLKRIKLRRPVDEQLPEGEP